MLANAVRCRECRGNGFYEVEFITGDVRYFECPRCHGTGVLCADCHKPEGVCECVVTTKPKDENHV